MIGELTTALRAFGGDDSVRAVVIAARGPAFCAGADLTWMQRMAGFSIKQNEADAMALATMLHTLASLPKPTIARVHGAAFAGGMGLIAACDMAVASQNVEFCLSEVKLGLIAATISPYVVHAIGARTAHRYFLTAERCTAAEAYRIGLIQELVTDDELDATINQLLGHLIQASPEALASSKALLRAVIDHPIEPKLIADTARRIAHARASKDGKEGVRAYLAKRKPAWVPKDL